MASTNVCEVIQLLYRYFRIIDIIRYFPCETLAIMVWVVNDLSNYFDSLELPIQRPVWINDYQ